MMDKACRIGHSSDPTNANRDRLATPPKLAATFRTVLLTDTDIRQLLAGASVGYDVRCRTVRTDIAMLRTEP